jgi:transposase
MRTKGTHDEVVRRQRKGLALLTTGLTVAQVARRLRTTERTIYRWKATALRTDKKRKGRREPGCVQRGRPARLSDQQLKRLKDELQLGAYTHGYDDNYWTLERIADLIWKLFEMHYRPSGVWHVMRRMKWSCQQPQRTSFQRDDDEVDHWKHYVWPRIKKVV